MPLITHRRFLRAPNHLPLEPLHLWSTHLTLTRLRPNHSPLWPLHLCLGHVVHLAGLDLGTLLCGFGLLPFPKSFEALQTLQPIEAVFVAHVSTLTA